MKKLSIFYIIIFLSISCNSQTQTQRINEYNSEIVGVWVSEDDPTYKIEFTNSNLLKQYINNELLDTLSYSIAETCGNESNDYDVFLKIIETLNDYSCNVINNIAINSQGESILSLTTERGKLEVFKKE